MATGWKRSVERIAARSGLSRALARAKTQSVAVLAYHNVIPHGETLAGDASLHVDQQTFGDQLDFVSEWAEVVDLDALTRTVVAESDPRFRVVITFDDAYVGTMTAGAEELRRRGLPGTVFVPPGLLGRPGFWWDALSSPEGSALAPSVREHALHALAGRQDRILEWAAAEGLPTASMPEHARPASEAQLMGGTSYGGLAFAAHTWSHANLAALEPEEARDEMRRSRDWITSRLPRATPWLTYPYGLHTSETVALASELFDGALLIAGGLARPAASGAPRHDWPRINVPRGLTLEGLGLRLAGLLS